MTKRLTYKIFNLKEMTLKDKINFLNRPIRIKHGRKWTCFM